MSTTDAWQPIETAPRPAHRQGTIIVAVPHWADAPDDPEPRWVVGEAWWNEGDGQRDPHQGWWWAGTSPGEYADEKIFPEPEWWQPLPPPPKERTADMPDHPFPRLTPPQQWSSGPVQLPTAQDSFWMAAASLCRALEALANAERERIEASREKPDARTREG